MQSSGYFNALFNSSFLDEEDTLAARHEKVSVKVMESSQKASIKVASHIAERIRDKSQKNETLVLGLATGSTPTMVYNELIRLHKEENLSFKNVVTFNLDEYFSLAPEDLNSYHFFMWERLFKHIDILPENVHIPIGNISRDDIDGFCKNYEKKIEACGGIDIQLLGIGLTGHIGFNEPGSSINSKTRIVALDPLTRKDASGTFKGEENVPRYAITMGVGTIMSAREIILLAWGEDKSDVVKKAIEDNISETLPASFLQNHNNVTFLLDRAAAIELTRFKTPWLVGACNWNNYLVRKAVLWLCHKINKPVLKLTEQDYKDNGLRELLLAKGPFSKINIEIFNELQHTITGWPGGKPGVDDSTRPERAFPFPKRIVIFSPHPDDDVISMGGTFARLVQQGHQVHVAYQTSGSIAVPDDDVVRYADFVRDFESIFNYGSSNSLKIYNEIQDYYRKNESSSISPKDLLQLKAAIRRGEARSSCRYIGLHEGNIHFLNYPFYESGTIKKLPSGENEISITVDFLNKIKPHQIYAAGDLSDPHGTHRVCIDIVMASLKRMKGETWLNDCRVWLYRGAWQEWEIDMVDMAVPLSPEEVEIKRNAIFKHQSQKDGALFMGSDKREFWQRAEERNRHTARLYNQYGMAEYEAIEVFVKYNINNL